MSQLYKNIRYNSLYSFKFDLLLIAPVMVNNTLYCKISNNTLYNREG